jgi:hypothetical protein
MSYAVDCLIEVAQELEKAEFVFLTCDEGNKRVSDILLKFFLGGMNNWNGFVPLLWTLIPVRVHPVLAQKP